MKSPFSEQVQQLAARDVKAAMRAALGQTRKLVVVDLDNTMWGGIVGDDGWENLRLGGHDYKGEAFVEFQKALKALTARGIQIGIVSKNEEATALEAIDRHPEMVLRRKDFCGWRINWFDKAQNIVDLARDLNLGLSSVVFLDDNPAERGRVREAIPDVLVPEWPENPVNYAAALRAMDCFDQAAITDEDRARTQMYLEDRDRKASAASFSSIDDWMASLGAEVGIEPLNPSNVKRVVQLINKTNQMNLATRRLTEADLSAWLAGQKGRSVFAVHVGDRFGNLGLTGVISWQPNGDALEIADFILSCRAMGRRVEDVMAKYAVDSARQFGFKRVTARAVPTAKNAPCLAFWRQTDFVELEENFFERSASTPSREIPGIMLDVKAAGTDGQTATG